MEASLDPNLDLESEKKHHRFDIWKHSYLKTCAAVDQELEQLRKIDSFYSGTTALTIVRQVKKKVLFFKFGIFIFDISNYFHIGHFNNLFYPVLYLLFHYFWAT